MCDIAAGFGGVTGWDCFNNTPTNDVVCSESTSYWDGITCDSFSEIIEISLVGASLNGTLSSSIGYLTSLQYLYLSSNSLYGSLPSAIGLLTLLNDFQVDTNLLTGTIPTAIGSMISLTYLTLYDNQLTGTVPSQLCLLVNLQTAFIYENNLLSCSSTCSIGDTSYCISGIFCQYCRVVY